MSFFALGSAGAVALGATAGGVAATAAGVGAAYVGGKVVNKLASGSTSGSVGGVPGSNLDINQIITDARTSAADNYKNSIALEQANNPLQASFRTAANQAAIAASKVPVGATPYTPTTQTNSLLNESADSILQQLRLGSTLPADVQAQVTRAALQTGGQAGVAGSFAGRGLVAQDIGTTSLALQQARQAQALQAGGVLDQLGLGRAQFDLARQQAQVGNGLGLESLAASLPLPESGLNSGSIASLYTGKSNVDTAAAQNQFLIDQQNANNRANNINKLLGFGAQYFKGSGSGTGGGSGGGIG